MPRRSEIPLGVPQIDDRVTGVTASDQDIAFELDDLADVLSFPNVNRLEGQRFVMVDSGTNELITSTAGQGSIFSPYGLKRGGDASLTVWLAGENVIEFGSLVDVFSNVNLSVGDRIRFENFTLRSLHFSTITAIDSTRRRITIADSIGDNLNIAGALGQRDNIFTLIHDGMFVGIPTRRNFGNNAEEIAPWAEGDNTDPIPASKLTNAGGFVQTQPIVHSGSGDLLPRILNVVNADNLFLQLPRSPQEGDEVTVKLLGNNITFTSNRRIENQALGESLRINNNSINVITFYFTLSFGWLII